SALAIAFAYRGLGVFRIPFIAPSMIDSIGQAQSAALGNFNYGRRRWLLSHSHVVRFSRPPPPRQRQPCRRRSCVVRLWPVSSRLEHGTIGFPAPARFWAISATHGPKRRRSTLPSI